MRDVDDLMEAHDRKDRRYRIRVPVTLVSRSKEIRALTDDVSFRGVFLRMDAPPAKMQLIRMKFVLPPDGMELVLQGMGVHLVEPGDKKGRPPGLGVEFFGLDGAPRIAWEKFIRYIQQTHPESAETPAICAPAGAVDMVNRLYSRHDVELRVKLETREALVNLVTENISRGGMFVRTDLPLGAGASVNVHLVHPDTQATFALECVVRRRIFGNDAGVGLEFQNMTEAKRAELVEFVRPVAALDEDEIEVDFDEPEASAETLLSPKAIAS